MEKKEYQKPETDILHFGAGQGYLQDINLGSAGYASEEGNPPLDTKEEASDWSDIWAD